MSIVAFLLLMLAGPTNKPAKTTDSVYGPLWLYSGAWKVSRKDLPAGAKPDELMNECTLIGKYFACQQSVNGSVAELLIFVPAQNPGHFHTQSVLPEGRAGGLGDLEISGNRWTFLSSYNPGKTVYSRTTNDFIDKNHIHFEQAESSDNRQWIIKNSGDEIKTGNAPR